MGRTETRLQWLFALIGLLALGLSYTTLGGRPSPSPQPPEEEEEVSGPWTPEDAASLAPNLRDWKGITVHHTVVVASPEDLALSHAQRGLQGLAYHFLILGPDSDCDGCVFVARRWLDQQPVPQTSHQRTNLTTVAVAVIGDFEDHDPSDQQLASLDAVLRSLLRQLRIEPDAIRGHGDGAQTQCPGHRLSSWLRTFLNTLGAG